MSYTAPANDAVEFDFVASYSAPGAIVFDFLHDDVEDTTDALALADPIAPCKNYYLTIADVLVVLATVSLYMDGRITETLTFSDDEDDSLRVPIALADALTLDGVLTLVRFSYQALRETLRFTDARTAGGVQRVLIIDRLLLPSGPPVAADGGTVVGGGSEGGGAPSWFSWVANLNTLAHSRYQDFEFNSFASIDGAFYGARGDGIYELDGPTDGATPIVWTVTTALTDFGSEFIKKLGPIYVGVRTSGEIMLKVVADKQQVYYYEVQPTTNIMDPLRVMPGKGLHSRYWAFELVSPSTTELESITFTPVVLNRRI